MRIKVGLGLQVCSAWTMIRLKPFSPRSNQCMSLWLSSLSGGTSDGDFELIADVDLKHWRVGLAANGFSQGGTQFIRIVQSVAMPLLWLYPFSRRRGNGDIFLSI